LNKTQQQWNLLSERLGVKPKQFAVLLAVLAIAVTGLGLKYSTRGGTKVRTTAASKQTTQNASKQASAKQTPAKQGASTQLRASAVSFTGVGSESAPQIIEMALERSPARDPFKAFGVPEVEPTKAAYNPVVVQVKTPGMLPGIVLKAVIRGELAVFGDQTVRIGDAIALPDGTFASVRAIADRSVTVDYDNRLIDVCFGSTSQAKPVTAKGFK
jgi:hypothetical protein